MRFSNLAKRFGVWLCLTMLIVSPAMTRAGDPIVDSQGHRLHRIEPQHFERGARENASFLEDHTNYNVEDDRPVHAVLLTQPFYVARHEVTRGQFAAFVRATGYQTTVEKNARGIVGWDPEDDPKRDAIKRSFRVDPNYTWKSPGFDQTDEHPVVGVSYKDALAYCRWLSKVESATYRLPTEAEWECACRAGTETAFSFGNTYRGSIHEFANIGNVELERAHRYRVMSQWLVDLRSDPDDGFVYTAPVGRYRANAWGLHDMHGNVWEWCRDRYLDTTYEQFRRERHNAVRPRAVDPVCDEEWLDQGEWRVIRGGSWFNSPVQCRSGVRAFFEAEDAACYVGFRVVREASDSERVDAKKRHDASELALEKLRSLASNVSEPVNHDVRLEFRLDSVNVETFGKIDRVQWPIEVDLRPPGPLANDVIVAVLRAPNLTGVIFRSGGKGLRSTSFAGLASHPELEHLQITGIGDLDDGVFNFLSEAANLRTLHLQGTGITDEGLQSLPQLSSLRAIHCAATSVEGKSLERFQDSPLEQASFDNLTDEGAVALGGFAALSSLRLMKCPLSDQAVEPLTRLRRLRDLQINESPALSDMALAAIASLRHLERLDLRGTGAGDETVRALEPLVKLVRLQLDSESLTDQGAAEISDLVSLRNLYLGPSCKIADSGLRPWWRLVNVGDLTIHNDGLRGTTFRAISELPRLTRLEIASKRLRVESLRWIADSRSLENLTLGDWNQEPSEDLTIESLTPLASAKSLKRVTIIGYREQFDEEAFEAFQAKHNHIEWSLR